jgi:hypothetical protein
MTTQYHSTIEIIEHFLQQKPCAPEVPLMTDGKELVSYGVCVAKWDGKKLELMTERVEREVAKGSDGARSIRRAWRYVRDMAKARGLL